MTVVALSTAKIASRVMNLATTGDGAEMSVEWRAVLLRGRNAEAVGQTGGRPSEDLGEKRGRPTFFPGGSGRCDGEGRAGVTVAERDNSDHCKVLRFLSSSKRRKIDSRFPEMRYDGRGQ